MTGKQGKRKITTVDNKNRDKADRETDMDRRRDGERRDKEAGLVMAASGGGSGSLPPVGGAVDQRPSVFSRLGNKVAGQSSTSRGPSTGPKRGSSAGAGSSWASGAQSLSPNRKCDGGSRSLKGSKSKDSPVLDTNFEAWSSNDLDLDDQSTLEKKREMLQRELARQLEEDKSKLKKMISSSSSSSSCSSSAGESSSEESTSSSQSKKLKKKDLKKIKKKLKKESGTSLDKGKKLKIIKKLKKSEKLKKKLGAKIKKAKSLTKEKKDKEKDKNKEKEIKDSPKKGELAKGVVDPKVRVNPVKPGFQERDKFGFYTAVPAAPMKEDSPEKAISISKTPEKRERKKSQEKQERKKEPRRDSPKRGLSKEKKGRDISVEKTPPRRSTPDKKRSPITKKSPGRSGRDRSPITRTRSPLAKGNKRGNSRDRRDLGPERGNSGRDRTTYRKEEEPRKEHSTRRDEDKKYEQTDRRREDRGSHGSEDRPRTSSRADREERGKRDDRRYDLDDDRRRRDERPSLDRRRDDLQEKKRDDDKVRSGSRGEREWEAEERRGQIAGNSNNKGRRSQERGNKPVERSQARFDRRRDWEDDERRGERKREDEGDCRDTDNRRQSWARGDSPRRGRGRGKRGRKTEFERGEDGWKKGGRSGKKRKLSGKKDESRPKSRQKSGEKLRDSKDASPKERSEPLSPNGLVPDRADMVEPMEENSPLIKDTEETEFEYDKLETKFLTEKEDREEKNDDDEIDETKKKIELEESDEKEEKYEKEDGDGKQEKIEEDKEEEFEKTVKDEKESKEVTEGLAEDFSDFGESDDDILNQEDDRGESRPDSSNSIKSAKQSVNDEDEGADVLQNLENSNKTDENKESKPEIGKENAKIADALGVDWSRLVAGEADKSDSLPTAAGVARNNWSGAEIIRRIGLSKQYLGEAAYNQVLEEINHSLPKDQQVELVDPVAALHVQKMKRRDADRQIMSCTAPYSRALSARMDLLMRRRTNGIRTADTGVPSPHIPQKSSHIFQKAFDRLKRDLAERTS